MRFTTERHELEEADGFPLTNAGEKLFVVLPRGVTEGFTQALRSRRYKQDPEGKHANACLLWLVEKWNLDDDNGDLLQLMRDVWSPFEPDENVEERDRILRFIPLALPGFIARQTIDKPVLSKKAEDF